MIKQIKKILTDLCCDRSGRVIYEKLGAITAHFVAAFCVIWQVTHGNLTEFVFLGYLAFAGGHAAFSKSLSLRYNQGESNVKAGDTTNT